MKTSSLLLLIIAIITFPIWIGIIGGFFGLVFGLIGGVIGIVAGVFGAIFGIIGSIIGGFFGWDNHWGDWHWHHWGPHPSHAFWVLIIIVALVWALRSRSYRR